MEFIEKYKAFLKEQREILVENQFVSFAEENGIRPTIKLRKSFVKLVNLLDTDYNMDTINATTFLFDFLRAMQEPKERELKKVVNNFCSFVLTVGCGNTPTHRRIRQIYSKGILDSLDGMTIDDSVKKSANFKTEWVTTLKQQLNTK